MTHFSETGPKVRQNGTRGEAFIQHSLRIPPSMYERLKAEASATSRSLHSEILRRIALTLGDDFAIQAAPEAESTLERIADDIRALRELAQQFIAKD
jgi:hypothetical protein